jgi:P27 family predicted phage terminase small subunit
MGARGPAPKPTKLKVLHGNPGHRKLNKSEPQPRASAPSCPTWLSTEAKAEWRRIVPELEQLGLLTIIDRMALAALCQAWSEFHEATKILQEEGRTFTTDKGYVVQHPAVAMQRSAWSGVKTFCSLFGLDPSSRSRLQLPDKVKEPTAFELFLARGTQKKA